MGASWWGLVTVEAKLRQTLCLSFASEMKRSYRTFYLDAVYATTRFRALLIMPSNVTAARNARLRFLLEQKTVGVTESLPQMRQTAPSLIHSNWPPPDSCVCA